jgi:hypothetical protein
MPSLVFRALDAMLIEQRKCRVRVRYACAPYGRGEDDSHRLADFVVGGWSNCAHGLLRWK